ncbi:hypothetical protein ACOSQ2_019794 [Xanthoceras sorbifolium]
MKPWVDISKAGSDFNASLEIEGVGLGCDMAELSCAMLLNAEGSTCGTSNLLEKRPGHEMLLTLRGKWKRRARQKGSMGVQEVGFVGRGKRAGSVGSLVEDLHVKKSKVVSPSDRFGEYSLAASQSVG